MSDVMAMKLEKAFGVSKVVAEHVVAIGQSGVADTDL